MNNDVLKNRMHKSGVLRDPLSTSIVLVVPPAQPHVLPIGKTYLMQSCLVNFMQYCTVRQNSRLP